MRTLTISDPAFLAPKGTAFDPITSFSWAAVAWAEGATFAGRGLSNNDPVAQWDDESGNARHLTQATSSRRPVFKSSVASLGNKPAVQGDGVDDQIGSSTFSLSQPYSVVIIGSSVPGSAAHYMVQSSTVGGAVYKSANFTGFAGSDGPTRSYDANPHLWRFFASGASSVLDKDGSVSGTADAGTNASNMLGLFGRHDFFASVFSAGVIAFAGVCSGDIAADSDWPTFKSWVASHYGLTIT